MNIVILAGGGGTRLWPLSRSKRPKQFQRVLGKSSLLELTRERLGTDFPEDSLYYSVTEGTAGFIRETFPQVPEDHILVEPEKRDTGPAMGFVAAILELSTPDEPVAFLPSDHYIADHERFRASLHVGEGLIRETGKLLDIGVEPTWPTTNLGYTHVGKRLEERNGVEIYEFKGHKEKPPKETAEEYIKSGEYLWHGNYYMWTPRKFLEAYEKHAPETARLLREIQQLWKEGKKDAIPEVYAQLEKISIDYAITEKLDTKDVLIIKAPFDWSDVGLWSELKRVQEENSDDNVVQGVQHISVDTKNTMIYGVDEKKVIATLGVEDLIIVDTGDALLVADKKRDQEIKKIVEKLQEEKRDDLL
ncbi:MAG: sugar phosphate nucleotidyltransferase [Patescibacteria group bacterium]|jgi:mannose-1-phosphate guanylyltransferase